MNDHVPDSSGLPLRAMVMVLLFLGVIFLLLGFQWLSSGGSPSEEASSTTTTATTTTTTTAPAAPKSEVRVYNISDQEGLAAETADRLRDAEWDVTDVGNMRVDSVTETTVFYNPDNEGEQESAEAVGKLLDVPVAPRIEDPDVADQPPGVIVLVTS